MYKLAIVLIATLWLSACATTASAQAPRCDWAGGVWNTDWATPEPGIASAPMTLRVITPSGYFEGAWGEPEAGFVWGEIVGDDGASIVGQWSASLDRRPQGAFLLHMITPEPVDGQCRFEGVYTFAAGQAPLGWFGEKQVR